MKYTRNFPLKLKNLGFEFHGNNRDLGDDPELNYEVWRKGVIEVTVEHNPGKVVIVDILSADSVKCNTLTQLKTLDKIINS